MVLFCIFARLPVTSFAMDTGFCVLMSLELRLVALGSRLPLALPQLHDGFFRCAEFVVADFVLRLGLGEMLVKIVVSCLIRTAVLKSH